MIKESFFGYAGILIAFGLLAYLRTTGRTISALQAGIVVGLGYASGAGIAMIVDWVRRIKK